MSLTEQTPLLSASEYSPRQSLYSKIVTFLRAEDEPSWLVSFRWFFFGSWLNTLLLFVPVTATAHYLNWEAPLRFGLCFVSIISLAKLNGDAIEQISHSVGHTLAGLLNASFGNIIEIIVGITALLQGEFQIVQTAMLGSILYNIVFVLGCSFFAGGLFQKESKFQVTAAQTHASIMTLACITLVIPAAYHSAKRTAHPRDRNLIEPTTAEPLIDDLNDNSQEGLLTISRGTAVLLLVVYIGYLIFQLKTHAYLFDKDPGHVRNEESDQDVEEDNIRMNIAMHSDEPIQGVEEDNPRMNVVAAVLSLLIVTVITAFIADDLVGSIEETATRLRIQKSFIGLILLPIVGNAAEHVTSVRMALKNKTQLTISICVGSSISANCHFRLTTPCGDRLVLWPRAHLVLRRFRDGLLFRFCDARQSTHSRRKIKLYGRPYVDHIVLCHRSCFLGFITSSRPFL